MSFVQQVAVGAIALVKPLRGPSTSSTWTPRVCTPCMPSRAVSSPLGLRRRLGKRFLGRLHRRNCEWQQPNWFQTWK